MFMKKKTICLLFLLFSINIFASNNNLSLISKTKDLGITLYWDSLSETGLMEKDGHQISFKTDQSVIILDSSKIIFSDPPSYENNKLLVSKKFVDDVTGLLKNNDTQGFKVGAILIDAGHGGKDPGALKTYKIDGKDVTIREKDINLNVAKLLYEKLKTAYPDKNIILTRNKDVFLELSERTDIANNVKVAKDEAIIFISIHVNSSLNKSSSGYEVWYLSPGYRREVLDKSTVEADSSLYTILNTMLEEEYTTESIMIAKFIDEGLSNTIGSESKSRGIKEEDWFVCKNSNMPSVLVELGFVSNEKEALLLNDEKYLKKVTLGLYNGIAAFITHFERSRGFTIANED